MKQKIFYETGDKWAEIDIKIMDGAFSMCGSMGEIMLPEQVKSMALDYWISFFEENPNEIWEMDKRCTCNFGPKDFENAAEFVIETDGKYHGLDVYKEKDGKVYLSNTVGQCLDTIQEELPAFPQIDRLVEIWKRWHLNDLHAGCEHQRALGWEKDGYDKHPCEPCPVCGYKYGTKWLTEKLPVYFEEKLKHILREEKENEKQG